MARIQTREGALARRGFSDAEAAVADHQRLGRAVRAAARPARRARPTRTSRCPRWTGCRTRSRRCWTGWSSAPVAGPAADRGARRQHGAGQAPDRPPGAARLARRERSGSSRPPNSGPSCCGRSAPTPTPRPAGGRPSSTGDGLRIAYRGALLRIAARDLCAPEPIEAGATTSPTSCPTWPTPPSRRRWPSPGPRSARTAAEPGWPWSGSASAAPRSSTTSATSTCCSSPSRCSATTASR